MSDQSRSPKALGALLPGCGYGETMVHGLALDSRRVEKGFLFAALQGAQVDGAAYIDQAIAKGAAAILLESGRDIAVPNSLADVRVYNARKALAHMAARWYERQPKHCVGVTGTNGKSSTVDIYAQLARALGHKAASIGTLGVQTQTAKAGFGLTTPDSIRFQEMLADLDAEGITHLALEASSHGLDQHRVDGVRLEAAGFANITRDHLDYHGDFESYLYAKLRLIGEVLPPRGCAVINADAAHADRFIDIAWARGQQLCSVGFKGKHLKILLRQPTPAGQTLVLEAAGRVHKIRFPLIGGFQVDNAVLAAGLLHASGHAFAEILPHFQNLKPVSGRLERVSVPGSDVTVVVDYAHTPDALGAAISALRSHTPGTLHAVFGCGGDRDTGKRPLMGEVAASHADALIVTDDNPRSEEPALIRAAVLAGCPGAQEIGDRRDAIAAAIGAAQPGDTVLIAGKGHESGQDVGGVVTAFDDREVARDIMKVRKPARRHA